MITNACMPVSIYLQYNMITTASINNAVVHQSIKLCTENVNNGCNGDLSISLKLSHSTFGKTKWILSTNEITTDTSDNTIQIHWPVIMAGQVTWTVSITALQFGSNCIQDILSWQTSYCRKKTDLTHSCVITPQRDYKWLTVWSRLNKSWTTWDSQRD
jgi:hypothetical protein